MFFCQKQTLILYLFSSPGPKGHVSYCHHLASVVVRPSVNFSLFNLLLENHWTNETKLSTDLPYKVLTKCCYCGADRSSKMAANVRLSLT